MDPGLLTNFASLMGMLATFFQERRGDKAPTIEDLKVWLQSHRHDEFLTILSSNAQLYAAIQGLLQNQHGEVMAKLRQLDQVISTVASHLTDFKPIAQAMKVESQLSDQAIDLLREMNRKNAMTIEQDMGSWARLNFQVKPFFCYSAVEPRFLQDDLGILCSLGLLRPGSYTMNGHTTKTYTITRAGAAIGGQ